jgi:hypothetical protein
LRDQWLRTPTSTVVRNVAFFRGREDAEAETHTMRMQQRLDTPEGREEYGRRFATVEPVFANVRYNQRLDRFTLRGRTNVNGQWLLFCLVHNIEKLTHAGYAASMTHREASAPSQIMGSRRKSAERTRSPMPNVFAPRICATRGLHRRCVEAFSTASTPISLRG